MNFAERLAYVRAERMLTQKQLAEKAGVGIATIARSEAGGSVPHGGTIQKIAVALDVEIRDLIEPAEMFAARRRKKAAA